MTGMFGPKWLPFSSGGALLRPFSSKIKARQDIDAAHTGLLSAKDWHGNRAADVAASRATRFAQT
eukprot:10885128-Alexandrium_andersonii.AAC.1